jgi:hypothetical protein
VAPSGSGLRTDPIQFDTQRGDDCDPLTPVRLTLAWIGRPTADHQRSRPLHEVANRHLLTELTPMRPGLVAVPPPRDHVFNEIAHHPVGKRTVGNIRAQHASLPPRAPCLGQHPERCLIPGTEWQHPTRESDYRLHYVTGE